jgi:Ser/Thr protein kinase RdoA (MazF antagonist)
MGLNKREIEKIAKLYGLGKVKHSKLIEYGLVNYNYDIKTEKGDFIIRVLVLKLDKYKKNKLKLEFKVLKYLNRNQFSYQTPLPLKNKGREILTKLGKKNLWIYRKIPGEIFRRNPGNQKLRELAKALAIYHKFVKKIKHNKKFNRPKWIYKEFEIMKKIKPDNRINRLVLKNLDFFQNQLKNTLKYKIESPLLPAHLDFNLHNMLYKEKKIIGILDFDNINYAPRIKDVVYAMRLSCITKRKLDKKKMNVFLKEYEKKIKLTKKEKDLIIPLMIEANCLSLYWLYYGMKKGEKLRYRFIRYTVEITKKLSKML